MLPPDTDWPADWLYTPWVVTQGCSTAARVVHTDRRSSSYCGPGRRTVGHWTRVQDNPTVASAVTRTRILLRWNIFYVPVDEHIQRSFTLTSKFAFMAYWSNWQTLWITLYVHFCKWNLCRYFMCECIKMLLRPVDCAIICPKRRTLCSITVSKQNFHFNNFEI